MKEEKYFRIPERPADIEQLWREAKPLDTKTLPAWLSPEDASMYRLSGPAPAAGMLAGDPQSCFAEVEELELAGLIVDRDRNGNRDQMGNVYVRTLDYPDIWSIGIYAGDSPLHLTPAHGVVSPVLTRDDVTDVPAVFVADPFMIRANDRWHIFFEVMNWRANKGEIGLATSEEGFKWTYQRIVLAEEFHLSYPCVFEWMGDYYMVPESCQAGAIRLYKAEAFPTRWSCVGNLLVGPYLVDPSTFRYRDKWWMFAETNPEVRHDTLRLYYANDLTGPWREHPQSPIVRSNARGARPGGRVLADADRIIRFAQDCSSFYGAAVRAFEITELTEANYSEQEVGLDPILGASGKGWNARGMHHIDAHQLNDKSWLACVDGWLSIGKDDEPFLGATQGLSKTLRQNA